MNKQIITLIVIIIVLVLAIFIFWPRKDLLHRNISKKTNRIILFTLFLAVIGVTAFLVYLLIPHPEVNLFGSMVENVNLENQEVIEEGDTVVINLELSSIIINGIEYTDISEAGSILFKSAEVGKKFRLVDNYALAKTYHDVEDYLIEVIKVDEKDIDRIREP